MIPLPVLAQSEETEPIEAEELSGEERKQQFEESIEELDTTTRDEAALNEDPEERRRSKIEDEEELRWTWPRLELYGSVRVHAIDAFDVTEKESELGLGDGASRAGIRGEWRFTRSWALFGRGEAGFDVLDTFTPKGGLEDDDDSIGLKERLLYGGIDSEKLAAVYGKNWSTYYRVAGMTDRYSIFGGNAVGIYNAGTDGGNTGTGRADEVWQARVFTHLPEKLGIKPFNLNLQYQEDQPIPRVDNRKYGKSWGASAWLESKAGKGTGVAYHYAAIDDPEDPVIKAAGIDGNAKSLAVSFRGLGESWYTALVVAWMDNIETTDQFKYINGRGVELYAQRRLGEGRWWLIGGANWLKPDADDPDAGEYEILYGVIGLRYSFDSFKRMIYAEFRWDHGTLWDGTPTENELTVGFRWDFGY